MGGRLLLLLVFLVLSGPSQAHHRRGHQNTEPHLARIDCGKVRNFVLKWEAQRMLRKHGKDLLFEEWDELQSARSIYEIVCFEA